MSPRRRVLQVFAPPDGGVAEHVLRLCEGLADRGWDADVAAPRGSAYVPRLRALGLTVFELPFARAPGPGDLAVARALRRIDGRGRYDLVHAHSSKAGALARAALPRAGRRVVYTPHCFAFSAELGRGRAAYRAIERALLRRTAALVAASGWEREEALRELAAPPALVRTIYCGAPACGDAEPDPGVVAFAAGRPVAGMISVLRPQKDPLALVRAAVRLRERGPLGFCVVLVGNGELDAAVDGEIARLGLDDDVALLPFAGSAQPYLRAFDLFVLPSRWESLPISVLEAMACGLPVVATRVCGVPEAVRDGGTGRLVAPGSVAALAQAVGGLMTDEASRRAAGDAGRALHAERFGLDAMRDAVTDLYATLTPPADC